MPDEWECGIVGLLIMMMIMTGSGLDNGAVDNGCPSSLCQVRRPWGVVEWHQLAYGTRSAYIADM